MFVILFEALAAERGRRRPMGSRAIRRSPQLFGFTLKGNNLNVQNKQRARLGNILETICVKDHLVGIRQPPDVYGTDRPADQIIPFEHEFYWDPAN